jgi:hypothetical protein
MTFPLWMYVSTLEHPARVNRSVNVVMGSLFAVPTMSPRCRATRTLMMRGIAAQEVPNIPLRHGLARLDSGSFLTISDHSLLSAIVRQHRSATGSTVPLAEVVARESHMGSLARVARGVTNTLQVFVTDAAGARGYGAPNLDLRGEPTMHAPCGTSTRTRGCANEYQRQLIRWLIRDAPRYV